jgi:uncharacterized membrane protein
MISIGDLPVLSFSFQNNLTTFKVKYYRNKMKTNPEYYRWGIFYFNPKDNRVILPKMNAALGWTLNFGSPITYLIIIAFVLLLIFVS